MKTITIAGHPFQVSTPYEEGHPLTEVEANVLNQTRCENIRNNTAKQVKDLMDKGAAAEAEALVAKYDEDYTFSAGGGGGGGRRVMDPLEKECRAIARQWIKEQIDSAPNRAELKEKYKDKEVMEAKVTEVSQADGVVKLAKKRLAEQQKVGAELGGLAA